MDGEELVVDSGGKRLGVAGIAGMGEGSFRDEVEFRGVAVWIEMRVADARDEHGGAEKVDLRRMAADGVGEGGSEVCDSHFYKYTKARVSAVSVVCICGSLERLRMVRAMGRVARYTVGEFEIAVVSDGEIRLDGGAVFGLVPRLLWEPVIGRENIDAEYRIPQGLNCMLVRRGETVALIETGMGNKHDEKVRTRIFPGDYGHLLESLSEAGVHPAEVTVVANTHLHADHCGWNTVRRDDGRVAPTFPNARYYVQKGEYEVARHPNERTAATYYAENFEPLAESGQLELVEGEREIAPGIHFLPTPGHTADHASIVLSSGGETAIYTGDLVHHEVQLERPAWIAAFDVMPLVSLETKKRLAEKAIRERALLICVHNAFPGVGRLTERDGKRVFVAE